jgi:hypothetical protein
MGIRTSQSPWKTREIRPDLMRLEDRVVPGEVFGTSMYWALGAFADAAVLAPDRCAGDSSQSSVVRSALVSDATAPCLPYVDSSTLTICQLDSSSPAATDDTPATAPQTTAEPPAPAASPASDQVFSGMGSDFSSDNLFDDLAGPTSSMGDLLHPGAQTPAIPNAATGAFDPALQSVVPGLSASALSGTGGSAAGSRVLGETLATFANLTAGSTASSPMPGAGSSAGMASSAGAAATGDAGGFATPLIHAKVVSAPNKAHPNAANGAAPFSPAQISQAYGLNLISNTGAGQSIYIVDAFNDPNISSDLATFDTQWSLPAVNLTVHKMSNRVRNNTSWGLEESLDVEWAHSIAPQAKIVLVEATTNSNSNLYAAVDWATNNGAHIVSMSFGGGDSSGDSGLDSHFNHAGVTYLASSGDTGAAVEYPAASPYVVAVGGTSLTLDTNNNYVSETAWSSGGGGVTANEARPGYQTAYGITSSGRSIPDVAFDADPNTGVYVYDSFISGGGGWFEVGGTSLSAPSWAGIIALADQGRSTPLTSNNLTSRTEYNAATGTVYASNYHDITTGSNGHAAGTGYDQATGVGSPRANNLVPWLTANN